MSNFRKQLGYVLENKNLCINGCTEGKIFFQNNDGKIDKQRKATLYTNKKGIFFVFEGKRNYVSFTSEENKSVESNINKILIEMIGDVGSLIAGLQTATNGKMLNQINKDKYKPQSNFSKWLDNLVKTEIKKKVDEDHSKAISLLKTNSDLIGIVRDKVKQTFLKVFGADNLKCNTINVDKVFGESTVTKYSFLAKENGFNSNDVDQLVQSIIYRVLKDNNRLQIN